MTSIDWHWHRQAVRNLGPINWARYRSAKRLHSGPPVALQSKDFLHPVYFRPGTSDLAVFDQIAVEREYTPLDDLQNVRLILDLGANVGYSSAYFLSRFPNSFVVAVEPDAGNFALLQRNLAPYAGRTIVRNAAVWFENKKLWLTNESMAANNEWGRQMTAEQQRGDPVDGLTIDSLIALTPYDRVSLLKVDIEGAEEQVFSHNTQSWIDRIDNFCAEVHNGDSSRAVQAAVAGRGFTITYSGELTIGRKQN